MGNMGNLLRAEGRLPEALADYETVMRFSTELGHKGYVALCLQAIAEVEAEKGDLSGVLEKLQQALSIEKQIGEQSNYASSLVSLGEVFLQQGEQKKAVDSEQQALTTQQQLGEKGSAAESQLALAEAAFDAEKITDAETLVRAALREFQAEAEPQQEIAADGLLARILLHQNKISEAQESIAEALKLSQNTPDVVRGLSLRVDDAYVLAASSKTVAAEAAGGQAMAEALRLGLIRTNFEATLALGRIQMRTNRVAGQARLQRLAKDAQFRGFVLVAREASASLSGST